MIFGGLMRKIRNLIIIFILFVSIPLQATNSTIPGDDSSADGSSQVWYAVVASSIVTTIANWGINTFAPWAYARVQDGTAANCARNMFCCCCRKKEDKLLRDVNIDGDMILALRKVLNLLNGLKDQYEYEATMKGGIYTVGTYKFIFRTPFGLEDERTSQVLIRELKLAKGISTDPRDEGFQALKEVYDMIKLIGGVNPSNAESRLRTELTENVRSWVADKRVFITRFQDPKYLSLLLDRNGGYEVIFCTAADINDVIISINDRQDPHKVGMREDELEDDITEEEKPKLRKSLSSPALTGLCEQLVATGSQYPRKKQTVLFRELVDTLDKWTLDDDFEEKTTMSLRQRKKRKEPRVEKSHLKMEGDHRSKARSSKFKDSDDEGDDEGMLSMRMSSLRIMSPSQEGRDTIIEVGEEDDDEKSAEKRKKSPNPTSSIQYHDEENPSYSSD